MRSWANTQSGLHLWVGHHCRGFFYYRSLELKQRKQARINEANQGLIIYCQSDLDLKPLISTWGLGIAILSIQKPEAFRNAERQVPVDLDVAFWAETLELPGVCHMAPFGVCCKVDCNSFIHFFKQETWTVIEQFPCSSFCTHYWHKSSCGSGSIYAGYRPVSCGWAQRWGLRPTGPWVTCLCIFIMQRDIIHPAIQLQKVRLLLPFS